jgi:hypothetical protein
MENKTKSSGIGLTGILLVVFLVLKLTGNISWSWLWVLSPIWIPIALFFALISIVILVFVVAIAIGYNPDELISKFKK